MIQFLFSKFTGKAHLSYFTHFNFFFSSYCGLQSDKKKQKMIFIVYECQGRECDAGFSVSERKDSELSSNLD